MKQFALVTGASKGLGRAFSLELGSRGMNTILVSLPGEDIHLLNEEIIQKYGTTSVFFEVDLSDYDNVISFTKLINDQYSIFLLINNAGITQDARLIKMTEAQFDSVIDVNLKGVFNCTQLIVPHMLEAGSGAIVNASSVVGLYGNFGQTNYSATKFGVIGFTKTWARELGPKGIRVNAVCPGFIATEMVKAMPENILKDIEKRSWLGRLGTPEEMANVYLFLASDEASYVNGVALEASGGISL